MQLKKVILVLAVILLFVSFFQVYIFFQLPLFPQITGKATVNQTGTISFCFNAPPLITAITDQTATSGSAFSYQVEVTDNNAGSTFIYYDNTSLFNIDGDGEISFTPQAADVGSYGIEIEVDDRSNCSNSNHTATFKLTINEAAAEEEEEEAAAAGGGGGAAAAGEAAAAAIIPFKLSQETIKVTLKETQSLEKKITLSNEGDEELEMEIINPYPELVTFFPATFKLSPGQAKEITLSFNPGQKATKGVHYFQVKVKGTIKTYAVRMITIVLEIESEEVLFDASLDLPKKTLLVGEKELKATLTLFNLKDASPTEVSLTYLISDPHQNIVYREEEKVTVKEQVSFSKIIPLPEELPPGQYLFSVNIQYLNSFATSSELFTVEAPPSVFESLAAPLIKKPGFLLSILLMFVLIFLVLIFLFIALHFIHKKIRKPLLFKTKTLHHTKLISLPDTSRLERKLSLLKESYQKGYLKKETYHKTKRQLKELIEKMKSLKNKKFYK